MKNRKDLNQECEYFSTSRIDDIAYSEQNMADYLEFENQELIHSIGFITLNNRFIFNSRGS